MKRAGLIPALRFGLIAGLAVTLVVTLVVTIRIWVLNPGSIFQGPDGTNWPFLLDTAWSWFAPLFPVIAAVAALGWWVNALRRRPG